MRSIISTIAIVALSAVSACAPKPDDIAASYVSPMMFNGQSCAQLNAHAQELNGRLAAATGQQQKAADNDAGTTALALILFWPAAFFIGGKDQSAQIAQMRGEGEALRSAAITQGCNA